MKAIAICFLSLFCMSVRAQQRGANDARLYNNSHTQQNQYYWFYRGYKAVENNNYQEAVTNYTKAIQIDSTFSEAYRYRGIANCYLKNYNAALADFDSAIKLDPEDAAAYNSRGSVYEELNILKVAIQDYAKAVEIAPHNKHFKENLSDAREKEATK